MGLAFLHLAVDSQSPQVRRAVIKALEDDVTKQPQLVNCIVIESVTSSLMQNKHMAKTSGSLSEEHEVSAHRQARLSAFLSSTAAIEDVGLAVREDLMAGLIVLGHHPAICKRLFMSSHSCSPQSYPTNYQAETHVKHGSNCVRKRKLIHTTSSTRMSTNYSNLFWRLL
jgi:Generalcontrol nonderepressible 1 (Gcn1) N-terminal